MYKAIINDVIPGGWEGLIITSPPGFKSQKRHDTLPSDDATTM